MALCVAVLGKEYAPIFFKCISESRLLELQTKVHASIDIIEEKLNIGNKAATDSRELFLGLLYATDEHKIFGYVTNTKIKFVLVFESSNAPLRDNDVRMIFRKLHSAYADAVCNPFHELEYNIDSKSFEALANEILGIA